jgi:hypothetical protein
MEAEAKPFRWSFSQWEAYNQCPAKWHFKNVLKLPSSPPGPAAARGLDMHDRCDKYVANAIDVQTLRYGDPTMRFGGKKPAVIAEKYLPILDSYKDHPNGVRHSEYRMGMTNEFTLTSPNIPGVWCVGVLDAVRFGGAWTGPERGQDDGILRIAEWKSGTPKDTHADQRKLYALFGLRGWQPDVVEVTTYYLEDTAPPERLVVKPSAEEKLKDLWRGRVEQMQKDKICAPRSGAYCQWCDYSRLKGGPCKVS